MIRSRAVDPVRLLFRKEGGGWECLPTNDSSSQDRRAGTEREWIDVRSSIHSQATTQIKRETATQRMCCQVVLGLKIPRPGWSRRLVTINIECWHCRVPKISPSCVIERGGECGVGEIWIKVRHGLISHMLRPRMPSIHSGTSLKEDLFNRGQKARCKMKIQGTSRPP